MWYLRHLCVRSFTPLTFTHAHATKHVHLQCSIFYPMNTLLVRSCHALFGNLRFHHIAIKPAHCSFVCICMHSFKAAQRTTMEQRWGKTGAQSSVLSLHSFPRRVVARLLTERGYASCLRRCWNQPVNHSSSSSTQSWETRTHWHKLTLCVLAEHMFSLEQKRWDFCFSINERSTISSASLKQFLNV